MLLCVFFCNKVNTIIQLFLSHWYADQLAVSRGGDIYQRTYQNTISTTKLISQKEYNLNEIPLTNKLYTHIPFGI